MTNTGRVALAARVFTATALLSLAALLGQDYVAGALLVPAVALISILLDLSRRLSGSTVAMVEGALTAVAVVLTHPGQAAITPYLAIPMLIGGLSSGWRGVLRAGITQLVVLTGLWIPIVGDFSRAQSASGLTWAVTGIGLGMLGARFRSELGNSASDASYRQALGLIKRLHAISERLDVGLDPVEIADGMLARMGEEFPVQQGALMVRSPEGTMSPLRLSSGTQPTSIDWAPGMADLAWHSGMVQRNVLVALPLKSDDQTVAVLVCRTLRPLPRSAAQAFVQSLAPEAVQLHAALLFGVVRDTATSQERMRIAREVHDGVAQDVAGFGYLVDMVTQQTTDADQVERLTGLRNEVTRVVNELRHSIFDLRQPGPGTEGLGESIAAFAQYFGTTTPIAVHVSLDQHGPRLQAPVEAELLRIAQEAMHNARKHSSAENLWLRCEVHAPEARIEILDDGHGVHRPGPASQGLQIMRERAASIGAELTVEAPALNGRGTRVMVRFGDAPSVDRSDPLFDRRHPLRGRRKPEHDRRKEAGATGPRTI